MPRIVGQQSSRPNPSVSILTEYWRMTVLVPFVDAILSEMETRFSADKRAQFVPCALLPQVTIKKDNLEETAKILTSKWKHCMPAEHNFHSELGRWKQHCNQIPEEKPLICLLSEDADPLLFQLLDKFTHSFRRQ